MHTSLKHTLALYAMNRLHMLCIYLETIYSFTLKTMTISSNIC